MPIRLSFRPQSTIGALTIRKHILPPEPAHEAPERFITAPMSACLDLVRFGAALAVMVFHSAQAGLYSGPFPNLPMAQHYAVVVFFVLSGLVITASVQRRHGTLSDYAIARAARIVPAAWIAIAFGTAAFLLAWAIGAPLLHHDRWGELSLKATLLPALFLSEGPMGTGPLWNPPYWSLVYEVWYYALFGAAVFLRGGRRIVWLLVLALLAGPKVLLMLPTWLVGAALAATPLARRAGWRLGLVLLTAGLLAAWLHTKLVVSGITAMNAFAAPLDLKLGFSRFALTDFLLGLAVATCFIGLRGLANRWPRLPLAVGRTAHELAGFSFTLYLFHWPLLSLIKTFNLTAGTSAIGFAALLIGMTLCCYAISFITERQRDVVKGWLLRWKAD